LSSVDGQSADITESSIARRAQASKSGSQAQYISRRYCYACNPSGDSSCYPRTKSQLVMSLAALPLHPSKFVALLEYSRTDEAEAALLIGQTAKAVLLRITTNGLSTTSWRRLVIVARLWAPATLDGENSVSAMLVARQPARAVQPPTSALRQAWTFVAAMWRSNRCSPLTIPYLSSAN